VFLEIIDGYWPNCTGTVQWELQQGEQAAKSSNVPSFLYPYLTWMKTNLIVFSVLQAREVHKDRVKLLHQNSQLAPLTFEIRHVIRQAIARSDKSFECVSQNLEFLQINAQ